MMHWLPRLLLLPALPKLVLWCTSLPVLVSSNPARELPHAELPIEGSADPHTYLASQALVACEALVSPPAIVPWDPSAAEAMEACSTLPGCGGFLLTTSAASVAGGGLALRAAQYCKPQSFTSGTADGVSAIGFVRYVYTACDLKVKLTVKTPHYHGTLSHQRSTCIRVGHGIGRAMTRDRPPRTNVVRHRSQPKKTITVTGVDYQVDRDVFRAESLAAALSADGAAHPMSTPSGIYYMPGASHAERDQPFALDGYFPLYESEAGAQYASIRGGGNGLATPKGPSSPSALPVRWSRAPGVQVYYFPQDGAKLYAGTYTAPFALDGYYPLYRNQADAEVASADGKAEEYGPGASLGHPLCWSNGQFRVYYMPASGFERFFGNYAPPIAEALHLYSPVLSTCVSGQS